MYTANILGFIFFGYSTYSCCYHPLPSFLSAFPLLLPPPFLSLSHTCTHPPLYSMDDTRQTQLPGSILLPLRE